MFSINDEITNFNLSVGGRVSVSPSGRDSPPARFSTIKARYDSALTYPENRKHWSLADPFSADAAMNYQVRKTIRERARYEIANNTYAKGLVLTFASDVIGTGPRIQLLNAPSARWCKKIEQSFCEWMEEVSLAEKLTTLTMAKIGDGEAFGLLVNNKKIDNQCKIDLIPIECDRIKTNYDLYQNPNNIDGVIIDSVGNPVAYEYLEYHPGGPNYTSTQQVWKRVGAEWMVHWFRKDRPEQHRGVSEIAPALPLFAQLRRYTLATIAAAETAADYAAILYTDNPSTQTAVDAEPFDSVEIDKRTMTVLPGGWKMGQFSPEQPVTTYKEFKREVLGEIARCLQVPVNIISGDSSEHNYASGRLDHQTYHRAIRVTQVSCARVILNKIFREWVKEFSCVNGLPSDKFNDVKTVWMFDGFEHVDPLKEASAQAMRLNSMTTTYAAEYAKQGRDWENEFAQIALERESMKRLGITPTDIEMNKDTKEDEQ